MQPKPKPRQGVKQTQQSNSDGDTLRRDVPLMLRRASSDAGGYPWATVMATATMVATGDAMATGTATATATETNNIDNYGDGYGSQIVPRLCIGGKWQQQQ